MTTDKDVTDKLLDHNRQQLSALMDDALSPDEARFLLRRLQHDESLAQCLSRWQLCGDVLRGHAHAPAPAGFAQGVANAIAGDSGAIATTRPVAGWRSARWGTGLALAASVAVIALFVARQTPELATPGAAQPPQVASQVPADAGEAVASAATDAPAMSSSANGSHTGSVPQPQQPAAPDSATEIAAVAAVAELPRRAAARRSRAQSQRAALRRQESRDAGSQVAVAAASPAPVASQSDTATRNPESPAGQGTMIAATDANPSTINPFLPKTDRIVTRPWPRALLSSAGNGSGFNVDYGRVDSGQLQQAPTALHPFQLRRTEPTAGQAPESVQAGAGNAGDVPPTGDDLP